MLNIISFTFILCPGYIFMLFIHVLFSFVVIYISNKVVKYYIDEEESISKRTEKERNNERKKERNNERKKESKKERYRKENESKPHSHIRPLTVIPSTICYKYTWHARSKYSFFLRRFNLPHGWCDIQVDGVVLPSHKPPNHINYKDDTFYLSDRINSQHDAHAIL